MDENFRTVFEVQSFLRNIAIAKNKIPINIDGIFGEETRNAVKDFQKDNGLAETGRVDLITWNAIIEQNRLCGRQCRQPLPIPGISASDLPIKIGDQGNKIYILQTMLLAIHSAFSNFSAPSVSGSFDDELEQAIMQWQTIANKNNTGIVDTETWNSIVMAYIMVLSML